MARRRLTGADVERMLAEYDEWVAAGPGDMSVEELAAQYGVNKSTLYYHRDKRAASGGSMASRRRKGSLVNTDPNQEPYDLEPVVRFLTDELIRARLRITELERQLGLGSDG